MQPTGLRQSFSSCTEDVLIEILSMLSQKDLHALVFVNRRFRALAESILYRDIEWVWTEDQTPPIGLFLRTILSRPEIPLMIRKVLLVGGKDFYAQGPYVLGGVPNISTEGLDLERALQFIDSTMVHFAGEWKNELIHGSMDAFVALLLAHSPGITHLVLGKNFSKNTRLVGMLFGVVSCMTDLHYNLIPDFSYLRQAHFKPGLDAGAMHGSKTSYVLPFFHLPQLQAFSAGFDNPITLNWPTTSPFTSTITSLDIKEIRESVLIDVLSVTPKLKSLRWEWMYDVNHDHETHIPIIDLDKINTALSMVRSTLQRLTITAWCGLSGNEFAWLDIRGSLNGLHDFREMTDLRLPLVFLATFSPSNSIDISCLIPSSVQSLTLTDHLYPQDAWSSYEQDVVFQFEWSVADITGLIQSLLGNWKFSQPRLTSVTLLITEMCNEWEDHDEQTLSILGETHGLKVEVINTGTDYPANIVLADLIGYKD
ncbi:hypothetical protein K461DRAFT_322762 [Myriangium duriaei CBS 260.36]|uniref:F-box domain-containing protein n=1 Tax=Myriangium duriaei CBS 260.36 TaxID=1168546 RepID=A0A9P4MHR4_9PEZI|nr:hypothetical protein K461DRAFT_322762 [Myriangium duriaei CBS 260.36]